MKFGSKTSGLGDTLLLSSCCRYFPNEFTIQLPKGKERFAYLFQGLADVEIVEKKDIIPIPDLGEPAHYATMKLRNFFGEVADGMDNRPLCLYSDPESEKFASEFLKDKKNPVIFVPTCSPTWKEVRNIPLNLAHQIYNSLVKNGFTPIVCQSSANFLNIGENQLTDLDLRSYICLMRRVKIVHTANTGDETLATSLGCNVTCYQPQDHQWFQGWQWNFNHPNNTYRTWPVS